MRSSVFAAAIWPTAVWAASKAGEDLRFNKDGTFQISILEDLHYGEAPGTFGSTQDRLTTKTVEFLLDQEPTTDFVVVNGDMVSRDNLMTNSTHYVDQAVRPILDRDLTWAATYGNHESNKIRSPDAVLEREHNWPNGRTLSMVGNHKTVGVTNYYLPVYGPDCKKGCNCKPELLIWFFDSRGGYEFGEVDSDGKQIDRKTWVDTTVVDWFNREKKLLTKKYGKTIPSLAFVHIPVYAFYAIQTGPGVDPNLFPGINDNFEPGQASGYCEDGSKNSSCAWGKQDVPFMNALVETPGLMGVFSAHKHGNAWCYQWTNESMADFPVQPSAHGLSLCYGQRTGYGGGGDWQRGSRQVLLHRDEIVKGEFKTWNRLETGEKVASVSVNETFGQDKYPEAPLRKTYCQECYQWSDYKPGSS